MLSICEAYTTSAAPDPFENPMPEHHELQKYGLTIDQYQNWKKNNPDSFLRKAGRFASTVVPGALGVVPDILLKNRGTSAFASIMGRYGMNKFNDHYMNKDLAAASEYYKNGGR